MQVLREHVRGSVFWGETSLELLRILLLVHEEVFEMELMGDGRQGHKRCQPQLLNI